MVVTAVDPAPRARWWPAALAWLVWALGILSLAVAVWLDQLVRQAGRPELAVLTPKAFPPVLGAVSAASVGAVVAGRRPRHPAGSCWPSACV